MDIELLRTFVEVYRCRHFGKAADRLYVTQSAVSARIRQLETSLGCQLLTRERKQVRPTAEGERFLAHAEGLLKQWERARRDMTESASGGVPLRIGAVPALWETCVTRWLSAYVEKRNDSRIRTEARDAEHLMPRLADGGLDLAMQFEPPRLSDIEHRVVGELPLVLATTRAGCDIDDALKSGYVEQDWGAAFSAAQAEFTEGRLSSLRMDSIQTVLAWLRSNDGAAYLPEEIVAGEPRLHAVDGAPRFVREIHACWSRRTKQLDNIESFLEYARH